VDAGIARSISQATQSDFTTDTRTAQTMTFARTGLLLWQWSFFATDSCKRKGTVKLGKFAVTNAMSEPPKCLPLYCDTAADPFGRCCSCKDPKAELHNKSCTKPACSSDVKFERVIAGTAAVIQLGPGDELQPGQTGFAHCSKFNAAAHGQIKFTCSQSSEVDVDVSGCDTKRRECQTQFLWQQTSWGECSNDCGSGVQSRTLTCQNQCGNQVSASSCSELERPKEERECQSQRGCGVNVNVVNNVNVTVNVNIVKAETVITGLDYDKLMANDTLKRDVTAKMQKVFADAAGVESKDVTITYVKGSVVVKAEVKGKDIDSSKVPQPAQVARALRDVDGIETTLEPGKLLEDVKASDVQSTVQKSDKARMRGTTASATASHAPAVRGLEAIVLGACTMFLFH